MWLSLVGSMVKNLPAKQEIQVQSLGWKDSLEREMTTHFSILAREIPMNRARQATVHGSQKSQTWLSNYTTIRWTYINLFLVQGSSLLRFLCKQKFMQVDLKSVNKIWYDLFFLNFILFLNFTILYWFCQTSKWIHHRYTCVPHPEPPCLLPPHTIPPGVPVHQPQYDLLQILIWIVSKRSNKSVIPSSNLVRLNVSMSVV